MGLPTCNFIRSLKTSDFPDESIIMGDMNVQVNKPSKPDVSRYLASVNEHNFKQYVNGPTHKFGNSLDHVICHPDDDLLVSCVVCLGRYGSDHHIIECQVNRSKPPPERRSFTTRCYKDLDIDIFKSDLVGAIQPILCTDDPNSQAELHNKSIQKVLDKHCPEKTRSQKASQKVS